MSEQTQFPTLIVNLSQEELTVLLRLLGIAQLPGFNPPVQLASVANEVAQRGLLSRGIMRPDGDNMRIDETIAGVIGAGAVTQHAMNIVYADPAGSRDSGWFYLLPDLSVFHNTPFPGVHHFETINDGAAFLMLVAAVMRLDGRDETRGEGTSFDLSKTIWDAAMPAILSGDKSTAKKALTQANAPDGFVTSAIEARSVNVVTVLRMTPQNTLDTQALLIITGAKGYYLVKPRSADVLEITPTDSIGVLDTIADQLGFTA